MAAGYVEKKDDVVNLVQVQTRRKNQVLLKVRFAEVSRSALTELVRRIFPAGGLQGLCRPGHEPAVSVRELHRSARSLSGP